MLLQAQTPGLTRISGGIGSNQSLQKLTKVVCIFRIPTAFQSKKTNDTYTHCDSKKMVCREMIFESF